MLEIERISWRNFLSYGNYVSTLEVSNLGQCLISGEVQDDDDGTAYDTAPLGKKKKSNGAGKSTIPSVMQWVLFGRTMHSPNPGDAVINWYTGKDCWGKVEFKNGDSITRTRNTKGQNELIYVKDGDEAKSVSDTLSTSKNQQQQINKLFNLDWEIFCGSTFFNQYGRPWMEMADQTRKKALERLLRVDRFTYYAKAAKTKCDKFDIETERLNNRKTSLEADIERLNREIDRLTQASLNFDMQRQTRHDQTMASAAETQRKRDEIVLPDLEKLKAKWDVVKQVEAKIDEQRQGMTKFQGEINKLEGDINKIRSQINGLNDSISTHQASIDATNRTISLWEQKKGKICTSCEQPVPHEHVGNRIEPLNEKVAALNEGIAKIKAQQEEFKGQQNTIKEQQTAVKLKQQTANEGIAKMQKVLADKKPMMTITDANNINAQWRQHDKEIKRLVSAANLILQENNPHESSVETAKTRLETATKDVTKVLADIERINLLNRHYYYIHKAYNDRTKIKSFVFRDHVPFINSRLKHYLEVFGLDIQIELTDSLGINSNLWSYEFESGGERKRTDVAFMLATFDFHEHMFGRQCNMLVLDEVDGRLDEDGIDALINIIKTDLANRVESLLIVSHRDHMQDVFPSQISVVRQNRFSRIESVR